MKEDNPDKNYTLKEGSHKKNGMELESTNKNNLTRPNDNIGSNPDFIVGRTVYEVKHWTKSLIDEKEVKKLTGDMSARKAHGGVMMIPKNAAFNKNAYEHILKAGIVVVRYDEENPE